MATERLPGFLSRDGLSLIFNMTDSNFIFYMPEKYFTTNTASIIGDTVSFLGILSYDVVDIKTGKSKISGPRLFNYPSLLLTVPSSIEKVKELKLNKNSKPVDYRLLKYVKGDKVIVSTKSAQDIANVESFYNLLLRGNLPNVIPYDEIQSILIDNMALSGNKYNITGQIAGLLISEIYRGSKDIDSPFRLSNPKNMLDYQGIDIREAPKHVSPFVSLTSENWDDSVSGAITTPNTKYSPMEKLLMS